MLLLLLTLALASAETPVVSLTPVHEAPPGASPEEVLTLAVRRMGERDFEGAALLFDQAEERARKTDETRILVEITYHRAGLAALEERYDEAHARYSMIPEHWPGSHREDDARFRAAETRAILGEPDRALREIRQLPRPRQLSPADRGKVEILRELWRLDVGQRRRPGPLRRAIKRAPSDEISFYAARGLARLAQLEIERAAATPLPLRKRALRRRIARRTDHLKEAEALVGQVIALEEPEWVFEGVLQLISGFEQFGDDLVEVPVPEHLDDEQAAIYLQGVREQAGHLWLRALRYADTGRQTAARLQWRGRRVREIEERYTALERKISGD